jgi:hypothetical protein
VKPRVDRCEACGIAGSLRVCVTCGYVGCCEFERCPRHTAMAGERTSDHPVPPVDRALVHLVLRLQRATPATTMSTERMRKFTAAGFGSGQAGRPVAYRLADTLGTTALVEREYLGGNSANLGWTPTKTMLASAPVAPEARRGAEPGVRVDGLTATRRHALGAAIWTPGGNSSRPSWRSWWRTRRGGFSIRRVHPTTASSPS